MTIDLSRRQFLSLTSGVAVAATFPHALAIAQDGRKILNVVIGQDPSMLMVGIDTSEYPQLVAGGKIMQSLIDFNHAREAVPVLAESWEVSPDGRDYTFHLRQGVTWHDGAPFSADDVVYSVGTLLPETHARTRTMLNERVESVEALDANTVRIRLKGPFLPFFAGIMNVNLPILPKHLYEGTEFRKNPVNNRPIGTGPFKFAEWRQGEYIHLVRNEAYAVKGKPILDEIYFHIIPDGSQRAIAMETGRIDVAGRTMLTPIDADRLLKTGDYEVPPGAFDGLGAVNHLLLNVRRKPFDDKRVRKAMMHAFNREAFIETIFLGRGKVPVGPIASSTIYCDPSAVVTYDYNPEKAKALLDEAGLAPGADGIRASFEIMVSGGGAQRQRYVEFMRQQLLEVGLDMRIVNVDLPTLNQRDLNDEFDIEYAEQGQFLDPAIGVARLYLTPPGKHGVRANSGGYSNPEVDALWAKALASLTKEEAQGYYSQIQRIVSDDVPILWLVELEDLLVIRKTVKNLNSGPLASYSSWEDVEIG